MDTLTALRQVKQISSILKYDLNSRKTVWREEKVDLDGKHPCRRSILTTKWKFMLIVNIPDIREGEWHLLLVLIPQTCICWATIRKTPGNLNRWTLCKNPSQCILKCQVYQKIREDWESNIGYKNIRNSDYWIQCAILDHILGQMKRQ